MARKRNYAVDAGPTGRGFPAPTLPYEPRGPKRYSPPIGLIGTGGIAVQHFAAYRDAGLNVVAVSNRTVSKAKKLARQFYPEADVYDDWRAVLARPDVEVVDITTHPDVRAGMIAEALNAGKHVLSQKPFVTDLRVGRRLCDLAGRRGVRLAVNQNGRWSPHWSYLREAVRMGLVGDVLSVHFSVLWDHDWIADTAFDDVPHIVLFDFGVHWFDALTTFMGDRPARRVSAVTAKAPGQRSTPPLIASAWVDYGDAQATVSFNAYTKHGQRDETAIVGTKGTIYSRGRDLKNQTVTLLTRRGVARPLLKGDWFPGGFRGTMLELLRAIEEDREPTNGARDNLRTLALTFAACRSADTGKPQVSGKVNGV